MRSWVWVVRLAVAAALLPMPFVLPLGKASASFDDSDGDGSIDAAEIIAGSDPHDPLSGPESGGGSLYLALPLCTDGIDNDLDGLLDEADPGCTDSDGDFVDDPVEIDLGSDPNNFDSIPEDSLVDAVLVSLGFVTFQCNDGSDNDLDGTVDEADPGCSPVDFDADGAADLAEKTYGSDANDPNSRPEDDRFEPAVCADEIDNDRDGLTDLEDSGCLPHPTATATPTPRSEDTPTAGTGTPSGGATGTPVVPGLPVTGKGPRNASSGAETAAAGAVFLTALVLTATLAPRRRT